MYASTAVCRFHTSDCSVVHTATITAYSGVITAAAVFPAALVELLPASATILVITAIHISHISAVV